MENATRVKYNFFIGREANYMKNMKTVSEDANNIKSACERWRTNPISNETGQTIDNIVSLCEDFLRDLLPWSKGVQKTMFKELFSIMDKVKQAVGKKDESLIRGYLAVALKYMESFTVDPMVDMDEIKNAMDVAPEIAKLEGVRKELRAVISKIDRINAKIIEKKAEKDRVYRRFEKYPDGIPAFVENEMKSEIGLINIDLEELEDKLETAENEKEDLTVIYAENRAFIQANQDFDTFFAATGKYKITNIRGKTFSELIKEVAKARQREQMELDAMLAVKEGVGQRERKRNDVDAEFEQRRREYQEAKRRKEADYFDIDNPPRNNNYQQ